MPDLNFRLAGIAARVLGFSDPRNQPLDPNEFVPLNALHDAGDSKHSRKLVVVEVDLGAEHEVVGCVGDATHPRPQHNLLPNRGCGIRVSHEPIRVRKRETVQWRWAWPSDRGPR